MQGENLPHTSNASQPSCPFDPMDEIDLELRVFIAENIGSVAQLEVLVLLADKPEKHFSSSEIARIFALSPEMTAGLLANLCQQGFAGATTDQEPEYYYAPRTAEIDRRLRALAALYQSRRVTVIQLIYSQPVDKLRSFADAFRFRKSKGDS